MYKLSIVYYEPQHNSVDVESRSPNIITEQQKYKEFKAVVDATKDMTLLELLKHIGIRSEYLSLYNFSGFDLSQNISEYIKKSNILFIIQEKKQGNNIVNPTFQYLDHKRLNNDIAQSTADILLLNIGSWPRNREVEYQEKPTFVEQAKAKGHEVAIFNIDPVYYNNCFGKQNQDYFKNRYMVFLNPYFFQSQQLLSILHEKMKKGVKVIICDNAGPTLTDFTRELGTRNLDQFQSNLAVMSFYYQLYHQHIALVFSGDYFKQHDFILGYLQYISKNMSDTVLGEKIDELESYVTNKLQKELLQQFGFHVYNKQEDIVLHNHLDLKPRLSFSSHSSKSSSNPLVSDVVTTEKASNVRQRP